MNSLGMNPFDPNQFCMPEGIANEAIESEGLAEAALGGVRVSAASMDGHRSIIHTLNGLPGAQCTPSFDQRPAVGY